MSKCEWKIFIHLGTHKTGTTSFQQFMLERQSWLRQQGIEPYIETREGTENPNCYALVHDLLRADAMTTSRYAGSVPLPSAIRVARLTTHLQHFLAMAGA